MKERGAIGPGHGPDGSPLAIAISPVLTGRDAFEAMRARIAEVAPGSRLIPVNAEGVVDEPIADVEVLLRGWTLSGDALDHFVGRTPKLRWIHSVSVGVEGMLTPAIQLRGLTVTNGRGVFDKPIAQYVLTMILALCRRLPALLDLQRERTWQPLQAEELGGMTVGLIGLGGIGTEVARLLRPFGCRMVGIRRHLDAGAPEGVELLGGIEALPALLSTADFAVLALPLTTETESVVDDAALAGVKRGGWLINVARGGLIDERALLSALRVGGMGGAVLDTVREEPLPATSPFYGLANAIVTPHTSWNSPLVLQRTFDVFCENLQRYCSGQPLEHLVDFSAGY